VTQIDSGMAAEPVEESGEDQADDTGTIPSVETESITTDSQQTTSGGGGSIGWPWLLLLWFLAVFGRRITGETIRLSG
jgi:uncharacterized protein (TIGR03382 family)